MLRKNQGILIMGAMLCIWFVTSMTMMAVGEDEGETRGRYPDIEVASNTATEESNFSFMPQVSGKDPREIMIVMRPNLAFSQKCRANPFAIMSPEDIIQNRSHCLADNPESNRPNWTCSEQVMRRTYGFSLVLREGMAGNVGNAGETEEKKNSFRYVEIPKSGSSFIKYNMKALIEACKPRKAARGAKNSSLTAEIVASSDWYGLVPRERLPANEVAFTFVRHPVRRFISGYGTIMTRFETAEHQLRLGGMIFEWGKLKHLRNMKRLREIWRMREPGRFDAFVSHYLQMGDQLLMYDFGSHCPLMAHVLSQTWFLNLYAGRILHVGRAEKGMMDTDYVHFFTEVVGLQGDCVRAFVDGARRSGAHSNRDEGRGRILQVEQYQKVARGSIERLNENFAIELKVFGFEPL